jgi:ribonuclease J
MSDGSAITIAPDALHFLPLGGSGEIGMNLNLYACHGKWLMVDLGITFAGDTLPGIDVIMPDPAFIEERRADLLAIVLTHAHEDHLGAVAHLWPRLRCPVYASPFAAAILREKLRDAGLLEEVPLTVVPLSSALTLGPFAMRFISLTHSIPEPNALLIETPYGRVMHTGDWKIDPDPLIGDNIDDAALKHAGESGVLAMVGDSTNATVEGESGSEGDVRTRLADLVRDCSGGVAITLFASNVARLESAALAAQDAGREAVLVGRSLQRFVRAARETGYLNGDVRFLTEDEGAALHPDQAVYLCTGCQGEPRAAMARIAGDSHPRISLSSGDTVIFSSKIIPGNERTIGNLHNRLIKRGIEIITEKEETVHVSGHPCRDELRQMYQWIRPQIAIPVHGEARHMEAHGALARELQVPQIALVENGDLLRLAPGPAATINRVHAGRLVLDGTNLVAPDHTSIRARRKLMNNGAIFVSVVVDHRGRALTAPQISSQGILDGEEDELARTDLVKIVARAVDHVPAAKARLDSEVHEAARLAVRRAIVKSHGKRPVIDVQIARVD